tara:strand:+ start:347 stop:2023 length:1677 start_codon:yes stop_codon:yes gene_type:complete
MNIIDMRVRNFRSIEADQILKISNKMTLVGPNNSGKTNLLKAVQVFFTGYENSYRYTRDLDLTFGVGRAQTSIAINFDGDEVKNSSIYESLDELHDLQGTQRNGTKFSLTLYFTATNTPVYNIFPNIKRPSTGNPAAQYSRTHKSVVCEILNHFKLHYVPSAKSVDQIYLDLLSPVLRKQVSEVITPHITHIEESLAQAAKALNTELSKVDLSNFTARFTLPNQSIEELISGFDFMISDPQETPIQEKGMGIQTTALLAAFKWITEQEKESGHDVIWLLEEPESYLHPDLAENCSKMLENLSESAIVITTTHAMAFVPQEPQLVTGTKTTDNGRTELVEFKTYNEAVTSIRSSLGIKFSDFYNLAKFNIFVEGPSDREVFKFALNKLPPEKHPLDIIRQSKFEDFGGVKHLAGFLRATYQFIRNERPSIAIFDGDDAGNLERKALQQFFGQREIPFQPNHHFISVRAQFAIEGLFPDNWISDIYDQHPSWFESFSIDAEGKLEPFKIKDNRKSNVQAELFKLADESESLEWAERFINVFNIAESALGKQSTKLDSQVA